MVKSVSFHGTRSTANVFDSLRKLNNKKCLTLLYFGTKSNAFALHSNSTIFKYHVKHMMHPSTAVSVGDSSQNPVHKVFTLLNFCSIID